MRLFRAEIKSQEKTLAIFPAVRPEAESEGVRRKIADFDKLSLNA
jgi:hypothetical protein